MKKLLPSTNNRREQNDSNQVGGEEIPGRQRVRCSRRDVRKVKSPKMKKNFGGAHVGEEKCR